ncbi:MAG: hypothetical protein ABJF10_19495 [Chthoniobacter sp.]|uniref:hypothetical protein n=1 Tax=Chthoniobacter sp. TaxID=2510640 RepID=UPI0032A57F55
MISAALAFPALLFGESAPVGPTVVTAGNPGAKSGETSFPINQPAPNSGTPVALKSSPNTLIVDAVGGMPDGGTYRANLTAMSALRSAVQSANSELVITPTRATPSFCPGATYLVFLSVLEQLHRQGKIALDEETLRALLVQEHQADGSGVWGRWNANGPGTARLFFETGLGRNFTSFEEARAGDFMKIFWNEEIGLKEAGHSVVFLGRISKPDGEFVRYWSSNQPNGFGIAEIPMQRIRRVLFSRLEHPEQIRNVLTIPARDTYLAAMLKRPSSGEEMARMVGSGESQVIRIAAAPKVVPAPDKRPTVPDQPPVAPKATVAPGVATASTPTPTPAKQPWYKRVFGGKSPSQ